MSDDPIIEANTNTSSAKAQLKKSKIHITIKMSLEEFEAFDNHAKKTGGPLARGFAEQVRPAFDKIKKAMEVLDG